MTGKMVNYGGIPLSIPNDITVQTPEFYISYNDRDTSIYGNTTTALVLTKEGNPEKFLILNGNHSKEYNEIVSRGGSYSDCLEYFKNNIDKKNKFSEKWNEPMTFEIISRIINTEIPFEELEKNKGIYEFHQDGNISIGVSYEEEEDGEDINESN